VTDGRAVLVVDDEPSIRLLCRINLELEGFRVLEAGTIDEARDELVNGAPSVVLLDLHIGSDSGWDLLEEIRAGHVGLPVCLLTGSGTIDSEEKARADAVLPKPFTLEALASTVRRLAGVGEAASR
jgi:DNA-binding NtrC family response regulator